MHLIWQCNDRCEKYRSFTQFPGVEILWEDNKYGADTISYLAPKTWSLVPNAIKSSKP